MMSNSGVSPQPDSPSEHKAYLTLGPILFHWKPETWRDFYFRMADEAPIDIAYIGEVVCAKRMPFIAPYLPEVVARLEAAGKQIVLSTLSLMMSDREIAQARDVAEDAHYIAEANDIAAIAMLAGRPHVVGPYINLYNEATLALLAERGAIRAVLPPESPASTILGLAKVGVPLEIQVFGRAPLAISSRCYHARAENLHKDGCRFVCERDPDGLAVHTLDGAPFLAVNGLQTLSHSCLNLAPHMTELWRAGIRHFRLSPQTADMVQVAALFHRFIAGDIELTEFTASLPQVADGAAFSDGFYRGLSGATPLVDAASNAI